MTNMSASLNVSVSYITNNSFHVFGWTVENAHLVMPYNSQKLPFCVFSIILQGNFGTLHWQHVTSTTLLKKTSTE